MDVLLQVSDLQQHFPVRRGLLRRLAGHIRAVDGLSFSIRRGETFGLVGESGCGKTTTAQMVVGLLGPTGGTISFKGRDISRLHGGARRDLHRQIQMIFQDPYSSLDPRARVGTSLMEPLSIYRLGTPAQRRARVAELLELVGMRPNDGRRFPHEFSGGQRQRLVIARALALNPELLVCDEPVSALDVSTRAQVLNLLSNLQARLGLTMLMITHDLHMVAYQCDHVAVMYLGKIVEHGPVKQVFSAPSHPYTQALLSVIPQPDPKKRMSGAVLKGELPSPANPPRGCRFHTRCPYKVAQCELEEPMLQEVGEGHQAACHLLHQGSLASGGFAG